MNNAWDAILGHVAQKISEAAGTTVEPSELVTPPDPKLGDLAFGCFALAQLRHDDVGATRESPKQSPADIAKRLARQLSKDTKDQLVESVSAAGPYLNVTLASGETVARIMSDVEAQQTLFGSSDDGKNRQLMLEYAQPNTHKEFHVGHLRNLVLGNALARILTHAGWNVVTASYHGDVGAHVAKVLWLLQRKQMADDRWQMGSEQSGKYLGQLYTEATKLLEEHPELKQEVSEVQQKLEAGDKGLTKLWKETRQWSLAEFKEIFDDLGTRIDRQYFESEVAEDGQKIVDELLKKGIAKESQGAIIVDLENEKLGVFLIRKSDGTSLYATKDLALAQLKAKEYPNLARSLILVDNRQSLYFKQLFHTLALMGSKITYEFVGFEVVTLKSGAMSSREGNIVTYESFRDEVMKFAREETRKRHADWNEKKIEQTAWAIAMGGITYGMLKQDSDKMIVFDLDRALAFDGDTGPYIQYAATRLSGILKKKKVESRKSKVTFDTSSIFPFSIHPAEKHLAIQMALFPKTCHRAAQELAPHLIAQWCFAMAHAITDFYRDVKVLDAADDLQASRLRLVAAALSVLTRGLDLLGIPLPDEM